MAVLLRRKKGLRSRKNQAGQGDEVDGGGRRRGYSSGRPPLFCIPGGSQTRGDDACGDPRRTESSRGPTEAETGAGDCRQSLRQRSAAKAVAAARNRTDLPAQEESRSSGNAGWSRVTAVSTPLDRRTHYRLAGKLPPFSHPLRPFTPNLQGVLSYRLLHDRLKEGCAIASSLICCRWVPNTDSHSHHPRPARTPTHHDSGNNRAVE